MDTRKKFGNVYIILAALLWSTAGVCVKYIPWSAYSIACFRSICGAITFCIVMRKPHITFNRWNIAGALAMFLTGVLYMSAIKLTTAANAIVLQYTAPILIILYNTIFEHRKPSRLDLIITACVIAGCVLAFSDQLEGGGMLGNLLALASGVTFAGLMIINRKPQTDAMESQLLGNLLSVFILMPFLLTDRAVVFDWRIIGAALFLGFFQYGLAHVCFGIGIKRTEPVTASIISTLEPICSPLWVFLLLGEKPGTLALIGFAIVLSATAVYNILLVRGVKSRETR
ncbi:MAG: EamA family transporter [Clostridiales bacterium]|nr:EamA family transporter [Clostridiales bacterium]